MINVLVLYIYMTKIMIFFPISKLDINSFKNTRL